MLNSTSSRWLASLLALSLFLVVGGVTLATAEKTTSEKDWTKTPYEGTEQDVLDLMAFYRSIELTPEQEQVREAALRDMPAPCCNNFSAATCCCECNLSRSLWGLAKHLIADRGADATQVRSAVESWVAALNPGGYEGRTCTTGQCNLPFKEDGCGGMAETHLIYDREPGGNAGHRHHH